MKFRALSLPAIARSAKAGPCVVLLLMAWGSLAAQQERHYRYVAVPGSDVEATDHGAPDILVFDIDAAHKFVRRISPWSVPAQGSKPNPVAHGSRPGPSTVAQGFSPATSDEQVRGIAADVKARRLYLSTVRRIAAIDLLTGRVVWEKTYGEQCCDRLDVSPDGGTIYAPALGKPRWLVIKAADGELIATVDVTGFPRQTIYSRDGRRAYLAAWESSVLSVVDTATHKVIREVGPFGNFVCPFTINGRETFAFANVEGLVGFEVGDLNTGLILDRVTVEGSETETASKYECPSHGIGLTPDERELWVADGAGNRLHIFDATSYPPAPVRTIELRAPPRWITFSIDGRYAYPSTGDVIDTQSGKIVATLQDERGAVVRSEKTIQIDFSGDSPIRSGHQVAIGHR